MNLLVLDGLPPFLILCTFDKLVPSYCQITVLKYHLPVVLLIFEVENKYLPLNIEVFNTIEFFIILHLRHLMKGQMFHLFNIPQLILLVFSQHQHKYPLVLRHLKFSSLLAHQSIVKFAVLILPLQYC